MLLPAVIPTRLPGVELRWLQAGASAELIAEVEAMVPAEARAEVFRYFTEWPLPLADFLAADPARQTFVVYRDEQPVACTSVYNVAEDRVTLGFTWVTPAAQGTGINGAMKQALFEALREVGMQEAWFRADVDNVPSLRSMEKAGAERMHLEDAPRVYPDRESRSVFYRRKL